MKTAPLLLIFLALGTLILSAEASSKLQLKTANFAKENRLSLQDLLSESGITHFFLSLDFVTHTKISFYRGCKPGIHNIRPAEAFKLAH